MPHAILSTVVKPNVSSTEKFINKSADEYKLTNSSTFSVFWSPIILVDGLSQDRTIKIVKEYEPLFQNRLKWVSEKDSGLYDAMNKGIRMATGDIIGIINSDDFYFRNDVITKSHATIKCDSYKRNFH